MKLRLDLVLSVILTAAAGTALASQDALAADHAEQVCHRGAQVDGASRIDAEKRILAEGYTEVRVLAKDCDNVWHAIALADGDPVNVEVTPQGTVLAE